MIANVRANVFINTQIMIIVQLEGEQGLPVLMSDCLFIPEEWHSHIPCSFLTIFLRGKVIILNVI